MLTPNPCNGIVICSEQNKNEKNRRLHFPVLYMGNAAFLSVILFINKKCKARLTYFAKYTILKMQSELSNKKIERKNENDN